MLFQLFFLISNALPIHLLESSSLPILGFHSSGHHHLCDGRPGRRLKGDDAQSAAGGEYLERKVSEELGGWVFFGSSWKYEDAVDLFDKVVGSFRTWQILFSELFMTVTRLAVFYKQRDLYFYPAWSFAIPPTILKVLSTVVLLFAVHFVAISMFRFVASVCRTMVASVAVGSLLILSAFSFSGFVIPKTSMPTWLKWGFWVFPLSYGEIGLVVNEFLAPRWQKTLSGDTTIGKETLESHGLNFSAYFFWLTLGGLLGFEILFNIGFTLALTYM